MVRWKGTCTSVKHVYSAYVEMAWNFLVSIYTQIKTPYRNLGFSVHFLFIIFFSMTNVTKEGEFQLGPNRFSIHLHKVLIPRAHESLCKSLALFWIFLWVDSVQPIIKRSRRVEIQLNLRKYQPSPENPKLGVYFTRGTCKPDKKFETNTTPECIWTTETLITYVYSHGSMKGHMYLREACIQRLCQNDLKFFWQACTPKLRCHTGS